MVRIFAERAVKVKDYRGFTLIEIMVTVAVLSLGIVMLYEAFSTCLNAFSYSKRRLNVQPWMDEKLWQMQDELIRSGTLMIQECAGSFTKKGKNFDWKMSAHLIGKAQDSYLHRLTLEVFWKEAQRNVRLSQVAYVQN